MAFFGIPRGRRKASATVRITVDTDGGGTGNATLYLDSTSVGAVTLNNSGWLEIVSSLANNVNYIEIFDSTGATARLGIGAASSEADLLLDVPGGNGFISVRIDAGSRLAIRAITNPPAGSEFVMNFYD